VPRVGRLQPGPVDEPHPHGASSGRGPLYGTAVCCRGNSYGGWPFPQVGVGIPLGLTVAAVGLVVAAPIVGARRGRRRWRRRRDTHNLTAYRERQQRQERSRERVAPTDSLQFDNAVNAPGDSSPSTLSRTSSMRERVASSFPAHFDGSPQRGVGDALEVVDTDIERTQACRRTQNNVSAAFGDQSPLPRKYFLDQMDRVDQSPVHPQWARELAAIEASLGAALPDPDPHLADGTWRRVDLIWGNPAQRKVELPLHGGNGLRGETRRDPGPAMDWGTISPLVRSVPPAEARSRPCSIKPRAAAPRGPRSWSALRLR
jgi:hypothetical protein